MRKQHKRSHSSGRMMRGHGGMHVGLDKPKQFRQTLWRLLAYIRPYKFLVLFVFVTAIIGTVFNVFGPKVMGMAITVLFEGAYALITNTSSSGIDFAKVGKLLILLASLYVVSSLFQFLQQFTMAKVAQETVYDLRDRKS